MKFRKKPVEIEAQQFTDNQSAERILQWAGTPPIRPCFRPDASHECEFLAIDTLEGTMTADLGDWIIRGIQGEFYPCKNDIFEATYEPVESSRSCSACGTSWSAPVDACPACEAQ